MASTLGMSRSPLGARSSLAPASDRLYVPAGILIWSVPACAFASRIAARSVQTAPAVAQTSLFGATSTASTVLLTVYVLAVAEKGKLAKMNENRTLIHQRLIRQTPPITVLKARTRPETLSSK